ncbi:MAG: hypothetical protein R2849_16640 [Thermomicrobiales bacterium]
MLRSSPCARNSATPSTSDISRRRFRQLVDMTRSRILGGDISCIEMFEPRLQSTLAALVRSRVQTVINGTGVIVHTNLVALRSPVQLPMRWQGPPGIMCRWKCP